MDKATYLQKKEEQKESIVSFQREDFCFRCFRLQKNCLCHFIKSFNTKTHFVLLIHPMEAKKEKMGTGRISVACLENSELITGIDFSEDQSVNNLINDPQNYCMVLYPGENALNVSSDDISPIVCLEGLGKKLVVFLIDGTWPCAKKMMKLSKNINSLPRVSFTATHESLFSIKEQPAEFCLSTLESIHFFLSESQRRGLEKLEGRHDNMIDVFKEMINFQIKCALDPSLSSYRKKSGGYTSKEERSRSKKWGSNRIVFKG
ncbi:MAG: tRNA-uridine aminocarboxypropyltransferase [Bacteriovorax sp.]|nr:tRNA-uridine aminocarboxypropyltransferase [Bacteriovorax sp.]